MRAKHPSIAIPETDKILPQYVIKKIYELSGPNAYYATGVGQHQMWAAQYFWGDNPYSFVTSGGLGTMGFEVPAAIGVQFARPQDTVWSFCGDGGFQMTMQELALCTRVRAADQVRHHQQPLPRHGAAVAGRVLRRQQAVACGCSSRTS